MKNKSFPTHLNRTQPIEIIKSVGPIDQELIPIGQSRLVKILSLELIWNKLMIMDRHQDKNCKEEMWILDKQQVEISTIKMKIIQLR